MSERQPETYLRTGIQRKRRGFIFLHLTATPRKTESNTNGFGIPLATFEGWDGAESSVCSEKPKHTAPQASQTPTADTRRQVFCLGFFPQKTEGAKNSDHVLWGC